MSESKVQKIEANWTEDGTFTIATESGLGMALSPGGPKPTDALLGALACSTGMTLLDILGRMGLGLSGLEVKAEGRRSPERPTVFLEFSVVILMEGENLPPDMVQKAVDTAERLCPVLQTLVKAAPVKLRYILG